MRRLFKGRLVLALLCVAATVMTAHAQGAPCTYQACALRLAPVWNGLDVVKGAEGTRVTGLGFFHAGDVSCALAANDSSRHYALEAMRVRRTAALLTDVGGATLAYVAIRAITNHSLDGGDRIAAGAGGALFAASIPLQFSADGLLSRAVWWFNESVVR